MSAQLWIDIIGWIGSLEVVLAYYLISSHRVTGKNLFYQTLNGTGAIFLIINTVYYGSYPSTFINVVWLIIAMTVILKAIFSRNSTK